MSRYSPTERIGVNEVERIVLHEFGWIFREQPIEDMGIDAHVERVLEGSPDGKLIALQIKTGLSHFRESKDAYIYYGKTVHLDYWTGHSLPVLLIAHIPEVQQTLWASITENTVTRTGKGWKVEIPKTNIFDKRSFDDLAISFDGTPEQQRFRKLAIDEPLMRHIQRDGKVSLELEDWINKSLGRTPVQVYISDENGEEELAKEWFQCYTGFGVRELAIALFPWANPVIDEEFYDAYQDEYEELDWRDALKRAIDEEDYAPQEMQETDESLICPYMESAGEVESYRLELKLNDLGKAFLVVSDHILQSDVNEP